MKAHSWVTECKSIGLYIGLSIIGALYISTFVHAFNNKIIDTKESLCIINRLVVSWSSQLFFTTH